MSRPGNGARSSKEPARKHAILDREETSFTVARQTGEFSVKKVLVPFDASDTALRAIDYAATVAIETQGVEIVLLHVLDPMIFKSQAALSQT